MQSSPQKARSGWVLVCTLLAGCAALGPPCGTATLQRSVALPVDIAATIAAAAIRCALPFSDPVSAARAVPATRVTPDHFRVVYERNVAGAWLPRADHRLSMSVPDRVAATVEVQIEPARLCGFGSRANQQLQFDLWQTADGTRLQATVPAAFETLMAAAIDDAWAIAIEPTRARPGLDESNLAAFVGHGLWQHAAAAIEAGDTGTARALLQRAARLPAAPSRLLAHLAQLAAESGDGDTARDVCFQAMTRTTDAMLRSQLASLWAMLQSTDEPAMQMRAAAQQRLAQHDLLGAETLLHTARRDDPRPAEDYRLLALLHRERNDSMAWATELLAKEHARAGREQPSLAGFVRRMRPMLASALADFAAPRPAAVPVR